MASMGVPVGKGRESREIRERVSEMERGQGRETGDLATRSGKAELTRQRLERGRRGGRRPRVEWIEEGMDLVGWIEIEEEGMRSFTRWLGFDPEEGGGWSEVGEDLDRDGGIG